MLNKMIKKLKIKRKAKRKFIYLKNKYSKIFRNLNNNLMRLIFKKIKRKESMKNQQN